MSVGVCQLCADAYVLNSG